MVDLGDEPDATPLEPLGHPDLPQRPAAVERQAGDVGDELVEPAAVPGRCDPGAFDVRFETEVGIVHPHRVVHAQRHVDDPLPERRQEVEPLLE